MKKKAKQELSPDFSDVAKELFDLIINRLDPISYSNNQIFDSCEWIGCFRGKNSTICSCRLDKDVRGSFYNFMVGLFPSPDRKSTSIIFNYMIPQNLLKNKKKSKIYGRVEVDGFSYRDENYFSFEVSNINKYIQYIKDIEDKNFIGVVVSMENDTNGKKGHFVPRYYKSETLKIPDIKTIKKLIKNLYYDGHGRDFRSFNVKTTR